MAKEKPVTDYATIYEETSFWEKISKYAIAAGKGTVEKALILYYCLKDPDTPAWAKGIIIGALGYFILPLDAIPDFTPLVGYADDLGALAGATGAVIMHIKPEHEAQAKEKLTQWFGKEE